MDIDNMSGKDLGIAVAKTVMGWTQVYRDTSFDEQAKLVPTFSIWTREDHDEAFIQYGPLVIGERTWEIVSGSGWSERHWGPWYDMNDAWEVVEKIGSELFSVRHRFLEALKDMRPSIESAKMDLISCFLFYLDVPEAILKAALKAKGAGDEHPDSVSADARRGLPERDAASD